MTIMILTIIFYKFFLFIFFLNKFGHKIRSFSKLTKIWCCGTLVYPCYDFNAQFWANLVPNSDVVPTGWNLAFVYIINIIY